MAKNRTLNKINFDKRVFERVKFKLEDEFEKSILANSLNIFGKNFLINFKLKLKTSSVFQTDVKADLLMIDVDYKRWWVVEVERIKGTSWLTEHVLPQIEKITHINYMDPEIKNQILLTIKKSFEESGQNYDTKKLKDLILFNQPEFLVIVNDYPKDENQWIKSLYNCSLLVVNIFRDDFLNYIYLKDQRSEIKVINTLVKQTDLVNILLIKKPSIIFDHSDNFFEADISSKRNNLYQKRVKFMIDPNKRNIVRPNFSNPLIKLKTGKYEILIKNRNITLTDCK